MTVFDEFSELYDDMFPWEARLRNEGDFLHDLFAASGARRVLDCACGTGMHATHLARLGYAAAGSDLSPRMIESARAHARGAGVAVDLRVASFTALAEAFGPGERFDAVICLGNSLTLAPSDADVALALRQMAAVLAPGGLAVIHVFNWDKLAAEQLRIMPAVAVGSGGPESLVLRLFHYRGDGIGLHLVVISRSEGRVDTRVLTAVQRPVGPDRLAEYAREAGFADIVRYGGFARQPFDLSRSDQLVMVARKPGPAGPFRSLAGGKSATPGKGPGHQR